MAAKEYGRLRARIGEMRSMLDAIEEDVQTAERSQSGPEFMSLRQTSKRLGISYTTAKRWAASGRLPLVVKGGRRLVPVAVLNEWTNEAFDSVTTGS